MRWSRWRRGGQAVWWRSPRAARSLAGAAAAEQPATELRSGRPLGPAPDKQNKLRCRPAPSPPRRAGAEQRLRGGAGGVGGVLPGGRPARRAVRKPDEPPPRGRRAARPQGLGGARPHAAAGGWAVGGWVDGAGEHSGMPGGSVEAHASEGLQADLERRAQVPPRAVPALLSTRPAGRRA